MAAKLKQDVIDLAFSQKEDWQDEGFDSFDEYEEYYVELANNHLRQSKEKWKETKQRWFKVYRRAELEDLLSSPTALNPMMADVPFLPQAIEEIAASLTESIPIPTVSSHQQGTDDIVSAANAYLHETLEQNEYANLMFRVAVDEVICNIGCIKTVPVFNGYGPYGHADRVVMSKIDPRYLWPDPYAKLISSRWDYFNTFMVAEPHDLSAIRDMFPERGSLVESESLYSDDRSTQDDDDSSLGMFQTPFNAAAGFSGGKRERAVLKEFWIKDERKMLAPIINGETLQPITGSDGEPFGKWIPKYPNGRVIYISNGVLLADMPNPFDHGHIPYSFFNLRVSSQIMSYGLAEVLMYLEDKLNILSKDMFSNARMNMNSPLLCDIGAFPSKEDADNITTEPGLIIFRNQGTNIERLPPGEVPQYVFSLTDFFKGIFDDVSSTGGVNRGAVQKGAQMSADAIQQLQGAGSARSRMRARLYEQGLKELGFQLLHTCRQIYSEERPIQIMDPLTMTPKTVTWTPDALGDDKYFVDVESGSSLPGARAGAQSTALTLYEQGIVDDQFVLETFQIPGYMSVLNRKRAVQMKLAEAGLNWEMKNNKNGSAGRKTSNQKI